VREKGGGFCRLLCCFPSFRDCQRSGLEAPLRHRSVAERGRVLAKPRSTVPWVLTSLLELDPVLGGRV